MRRASVSALVLAAILGACGTSPATDAQSPGGCDAPETCETYVPPSTFSPSSTPADFVQNVMPLITRSCAFSSCHGTPNGPAGGMSLGVATDANPDPNAATYADLVGVASNDVPSMVRVKPGDPDSSFLQHKIDGDACTVAECSGTCAESMPQGQCLMAVNDRLTFRAWIALGAAGP